MRIPPWPSRVAASFRATASRTVAAVRVTSPAGSSSVPISKTKVAGVPGTAVDTGSSAGAGGPTTPSGWPSSARRSTHRCATSRASPRIRLKAAARSVVETTPRESSTLKVCEHFNT